MSSSITIKFTIKKKNQQINQNIKYSKLFLHLSKDKIIAPLKVCFKSRSCEQNNTVTLQQFFSQHDAPVTRIHNFGFDIIY
jgi:hypothetical protein